MSDKKEIYADGIGQIHFTGNNMIRFDLVSLQPDCDGKATAESKVRLIMPLQGFFSTYQSMQQLINRLVDAGVLKKSAQ